MASSDFELGKMLKSLGRMDSLPQQPLLWEDKEVKFDTPHL